MSDLKSATISLIGVTIVYSYSELQFSPFVLMCLLVIQSVFLDDVHDSLLRVKELHVSEQKHVQSGLNISESVILTNSNNDADLVGTNFFQRYFNPL